MTLGVVARAEAGLGEPAAGVCNQRLLQLRIAREMAYGARHLPGIARIDVENIFFLKIGFQASHIRTYNGHSKNGGFLDDSDAGGMEVRL